MAEPEELFTKAQKSEIIFQYSKLGSATFVWRRFRNHYPNIPNSRIPAVRTARLKTTTVCPSTVLLVKFELIKKKVWLILQKKLKLHPYKQYDVLDLSDQMKEGKVEFCTGAAYCTDYL